MRLTNRFVGGFYSVRVGGEVVPGEAVLVVLDAYLRMVPQGGQEGTLHTHASTRNRIKMGRDVTTPK